MPKTCCLIGRALLALLLTPASIAMAAEGVIEINEASVASGDVTGTGGDAAGYPVTLDLPGRYVLTSNLSPSSGNALEVQVDGVVVDLNGFAIFGTAGCSGSPGAISCPGGSDHAVDGAGFSAVVRNGLVTGFSGGGVRLGDESRVERVRASLNGGSGISVGDRSLVIDNLAVRNAGNGIVTGDDGLVRGNDASGNSGVGLVLGVGTGFEKNVSNANGVGAYSGGIELHENVCEGSLTCSAVAELCDGVDNDGDSLVDEDYPDLGNTCSSNIGACSEGSSVCAPGGTSTECSGVEPTAEICNGIDDDCDAVVDEGNPGGGGACATGLPGQCAAGSFLCSAGTLQCVQNQFPSAETCDGIDNDCDGVVDDGNPGGGGACATGLLGQCAAGTLSCSGGALQCTQDQGPTSEVCDGIDNDCDGLVDEDFDFNTDINNCGGCGNVCEGGQVCNSGFCVTP